MDDLKTPKVVIVDPGHADIMKIFVKYWLRSHPTWAIDNKIDPKWADLEVPNLCKKEFEIFKEGWYAGKENLLNG